MAFGEHLSGAWPPADAETTGMAPGGRSPSLLWSLVTSRVTSRLDGAAGTHTPREGEQRLKQIGKVCREPQRPLVVVGGTARWGQSPESGSSGRLRDGGSVSSSQNRWGSIPGSGATPLFTSPATKTIFVASPCISALLHPQAGLSLWKTSLHQPGSGEEQVPPKPNMYICPPCECCPYTPHHPQNMLTLCTCVAFQHCFQVGLT